MLIFVNEGLTMDHLISRLQLLTSFLLSSLEVGFNLVNFLKILEPNLEVHLALWLALIN